MLGPDVQRGKAGEGGEDDVTPFHCWRRASGVTNPKLPTQANSPGKPARPHKLKANTAAENKNQLREDTQDSSATERTARRAQTMPTGSQQHTRLPSHPAAGRLWRAFLLDNTALSPASLYPTPRIPTTGDTRLLNHLLTRAHHFKLNLLLIWFHAWQPTKNLSIQSQPWP